MALAPGSQLAQTFGDDLQARAITTMVLFGAATDDPNIDPHRFLSPDVYAAVAERSSRAAWPRSSRPCSRWRPGPTIFTTDPRTDPAGKAWLAENDPGKVASPSPLLVVQGGQDPLVLPARTAALFTHLCGLGQVVKKIDIPTASHDTVVSEGADQVAPWIVARFAGIRRPTAAERGHRRTGRQIEPHRALRADVRG